VYFDEAFRFPASRFSIFFERTDGLCDLSNFRFLRSFFWSMRVLSFFRNGRQMAACSFCQFSRAMEVSRSGLWVCWLLMFPTLLLFPERLRRSVIRWLVIHMHLLLLCEEHLPSFWRKFWLQCPSCCLPQRGPVRRVVQRYFVRKVGISALPVLRMRLSFTAGLRIGRCVIARLDTRILVNWWFYARRRMIVFCVRITFSIRTSRYYRSSMTCS
jgi:hypothetical protein